MFVKSLFRLYQRPNALLSIVRMVKQQQLNTFEFPTSILNADIHRTMTTHLVMYGTTDDSVPN